MTEFLYWKQIQGRLSDHFLQDGAAKNFYDVVLELWKEGAAHRAEELPAVSFTEWDATDYEWFDRIYDRVPIAMELFYHDFERQVPGNRASEDTITMDVVILRIAYDQAVGLHHHDFFEIDYVMSGNAKLELENGSRALCPGEFCFLSPGLKHDIVPEHGAQVISITVAGATVEQTLYRLLRRDTILTNFFHSVLDNDKIGYMLIATPDERRIREVIRGMLHEHFVREEFAADIMPDHLAILFAFILRSCGNQYEWHGGDEDRRGQQSMLSVLKYMREHYRTCTLNDLAERFHYEPSYLGKQIKAGTGKNYTDIIREIRTEEAKRLLRSTDLSVEDVAEQVGYTGRVHFYRSFRESTGMTPGDYRKKKRV